MKIPFLHSNAPTRLNLHVHALTLKRRLQNCFIFIIGVKGIHQRTRQKSYNVRQAKSYTWQAEDVSESLRRSFKENSSAVCLKEEDMRLQHHIVTVIPETSSGLSRWPDLDALRDTVRHSVASGEFQALALVLRVPVECDTCHRFTSLRRPV